MDSHYCKNCDNECDCIGDEDSCECCNACVDPPDFYEDDYEDDLDDDNLDDNWTAPIVIFDDDGSDEGSDD